ncbi:heparan-alpha-glucosaminide N-acetyltransferase domain-containing protein [Parasphingorhabdus pacifica]
MSVTRYSSPSGQASDNRRRRLAGIDIARFVAVFGMFSIHFGVPFASGAVAITIAQFSSGRSTALFTFLAGVSLAMLSGRGEPLTGPALRDARIRVAVRAGILLLVGLALAKATETTGFLLTVIISFYGLYFLLAVPFLGLTARKLAVAALLVAVLGPQLSFVLRTWIAEDTPFSRFVHTVNSFDPGHLIANMGLFDLLLLDFYPAASYLALVLAGLAVGRLDLRSTTVRIRMALSGVALAVVASGVSTLLTLLVAARPISRYEGVVPVESPGLLLTHAAHSGTTFELMASLGIAVAIVAGCLEIADRSGRWLHPLAKAGSMALTLYAIHALVLSWQIVTGGWPLSGVPDDLAKLASMGPVADEIPDLPAFPPDGHRPEGAVALINTFMPEIFLVFTLVFASVWSRFAARGPLESAVSESVQWVTEQLPRLRALLASPTKV